MKSMKYLIVAVIVVIIGAFFACHWVPVKYAIHEKDFSHYPDSIIVRETWHTGTGWEQIGDSNGYLDQDEIKDIILEGDLPPNASLGQYANNYLCIVKIMDATDLGWNEIFDKYEVLDWYPVYPVKRETILPVWLYPKEFMTRSDIH